MPKPPVIPDAELRKLLDGGVPPERIALLCRVPETQILRQIAALDREQARQEALAAVRLRAALGGRPLPPDELLDVPGRFAPAAPLLDWARAVFLSDTGPLYNADHDHLAYASLAFLWTSTGYRKQGRVVAGQAEMPSVQGNAWLRARMEQQLVEWFGLVPTFLITLHGPLAAEADDASFCALVEHEIYHCGHKLDRDGWPAYNKDGLPVLGIKGHDAEEHVGVVRRYGVGAAAAGVAQLVAAARRAPSVAEARITKACGTCRRQSL